MIDHLGYPYCRGEFFLETIEEDLGQYDDEKNFWATGCALFIRREDFWKMKGFDERFFAHQEEIDSMLASQNAGRKFIIGGKSTVFMLVVEHLTSNPPQKTFF